MNIFAMTCREVTAEMENRFGKGAFHANALYRELFRKGNRSFGTAPEFAASGALGEKLAAAIRFPSFQIVACRKNSGGVTKFAAALHDGNILETVILPAHNRITVCVSSQVGCAVGCKMCLTGTSGFVRNLSAQEIVSQIYTARFELNVPVDNVVFMGMGEPLDNLDNVLQAVRVLNDQRGFDIPLRAITISTAGIIPGINQLTAMKMPNLRLAVSINAADDDLRSYLMPINRIYPLAELKKALLSLPLGKDGVIFVEYVLLAGVNDSAEMALKLAGYLQGLKVRVNVIAFNQSASLPYASPTREQVDRFCRVLTDNNLFVRIRASLGSEIDAACGQLRGALG